MSRGIGSRPIVPLDRSTLSAIPVQPNILFSLTMGHTSYLGVAHPVQAGILDGARGAPLHTGGVTLAQVADEQLALSWVYHNTAKGAGLNTSVAANASLCINSH